MSASQTNVAWMAAIVTYQRYVAISRPLHARQYITMSLARVAIAVVWIGSIIIRPNAPLWCVIDSTDMDNQLKNYVKAAHHVI